jgi:hypothetical protein
MKYTTVEDVIESFPHPILPTLQGEPDYQIIHAIRKSLQANSRAIDTHLGGGTLGHLGLIVSDAYYAMLAPATDADPTLWVSPTAPGRDQANTDDTAAHISAARHIWEEDVQTYRIYTSVQQALKKQIISVFEPMYLDVLNDNMVGFANISARDMMGHLFTNYGNITAVFLKSTLNTCGEHGIPNNLLNPCSRRFKIVPINLRQGASLLDTHRRSTLDMQNIFATGHFMSACRRWNEKTLADKTWAQFKAHFSAAHLQHKQMQGESAATAGYHSANEAVGQTEDQMAEATIGALANLTMATAADRGVVATLTEANARLVKQLEDNSNELREIKALINKERFEKRGQRSFNPSPNNYC